MLDDLECNPKFKFDVGYLLSLKVKRGFAKKRRELIQEVSVLNNSISFNILLVHGGVHSEVDSLIKESKVRRDMLVAQVIKMSVV